MNSSNSDRNNNASLLELFYSFSLLKEYYISRVVRGIVVLSFFFFFFFFFKSTNDLFSKFNSLKLRDIEYIWVNLGRLERLKKLLLLGY